MGNQSTSYLTILELKASVCPDYIPAPHHDNDGANLLQDGASLVYNTIYHNITVPNEANYSEASHTDVGAHQASPYQNISEILYSKVIVVICTLGLIGNLLNMLILVPKGIHCPLGHIEKFAYSGLVALALSDSLFCLMILPHGFLNLDSMLFDEVTFKLVYDTYSNAIINTAMLCSTWLTVTLALGRYLAVCHPIHARGIMDATFAKRSLFSVITCCILFNLPRFWEFSIELIECDGGERMYFTYYGYMKKNQLAYTVYMWVYFVLAILLPFVFLMLSNWQLIRSLRRSRKQRSQMRAAPGVAMDTNTAMTSVLVAVVIMYILLVSPAELINFLRRRFIGDTEIFNLSVAIVNTLQAINFSVNFILYYVINKSFRSSFYTLITCRWRHGHRHVRRTSTYLSVSRNGSTRC